MLEQALSLLPVTVVIVLVVFAAALGFACYLYTVRARRRRHRQTQAAPGEHSALLGHSFYRGRGAEQRLGLPPANPGYVANVNSDQDQEPSACAAADLELRGESKSEGFVLASPETIQRINQGRSGDFAYKYVLKVPHHHPHPVTPESVRHTP